MAARDKLVPIIVAFPLFLQNLDTSVMATALPTIARSLDVDALQLNLAITAYLLSLAVFLPLSGWLADRFGAKPVFCFAIGCFSLGSALCGVAESLMSLVMFRIIQGLGGAMMVPVGRLILLRRVPPAAMVAAMVWYTVPPAIGRMVGPLFGGAIVTWTSWRWIFLVNVPFGLLGIALAALFITDSREDKRAGAVRPNGLHAAGPGTDRLARRTGNRWQAVRRRLVAVGTGRAWRAGPGRLFPGEPAQGESDHRPASAAVQDLPCIDHWRHAAAHCHRGLAFPAAPDASSSASACRRWTPAC